MASISPISPSESMHHADAAHADPSGLVGQFETDVRRRKHGRSLIGTRPGQPLLDASLGLPQTFRYTVFHSKSSLCRGVGLHCVPMIPVKQGWFRVFLCNQRESFACLRSSELLLNYIAQVRAEREIVGADSEWENLVPIHLLQNLPFLCIQQRRGRGRRSVFAVEHRPPRRQTLSSFSLCNHVMQNYFRRIFTLRQVVPHFHELREVLGTFLKLIRRYFKTDIEPTKQTIFMLAKRYWLLTCGHV